MFLLLGLLFRLFELGACLGVDCVDAGVWSVEVCAAAMWGDYVDCVVGDNGCAEWLGEGFYWRISMG